MDLAFVEQRSSLSLAYDTGIVLRRIQGVKLAAERIANIDLNVHEDAKCRHREMQAKPSLHIPKVREPLKDSNRKRDPKASAQIVYAYRINPIIRGGITPTSCDQHTSTMQAVHSPYQ